MSIVVISVLCSLQFILMIAFINSLLRKEKIDLENRFTKEDIEEKIYGVSSLPTSNSMIGKIYRRHIEKKVDIKFIGTISTLLGMNLDIVQSKIKILKLENISAIEILLLKVIGIFAGVITIVPAIITKNLVLGIIGFLLFVVLFLIPLDKINEAVKKREESILKELPQYIELTYMCINAGATLKEALELVAQKQGGVLGEEMNKAFVLSQYSGGWTVEITEMALNIGVKPLQEFINEILSAQKKGSEVAESLKKSVEQITILQNSKVKEKIASLENRMMFPIMLFFMLPMMAIILAPTLIQAMISMS